MDQGKTLVNGPHQGALVETQTGEPWFIHFQDKGAYGMLCIILDLEAMKYIGIGGAICFNVGVGIPHGPVDYANDEWIDMVYY